MGGSAVGKIKFGAEYKLEELLEGMTEENRHEEFPLPKWLLTNSQPRPPRDLYATLRAILNDAFAQAASGKGKERHARDLPFNKQPMLETTRLVGVGFPLGQAIKKAGEAAGMVERGQYDAAEAECLGAINYLAGAVAWMRERSSLHCSAKA